ncbi:hypothetical protein [Bradyrhizobium sp. SZCCHNRI1002]|uniref:hypothetical protein n=1 Tax=Bradyrhizobium sp. SZCCHNRI1002 TaxID=3057274 RepID=UPI0028E5FFDD|nr:hypothetical protein [Bradyrhizobium sp. SZCCHNRI1002]
MVEIREVDGITHAGLLNFMNDLDAAAPRLQAVHLLRGIWLVAVDENNVAVGFAGMTRPGLDQVQRCYVLPEQRSIRPRLWRRLLARGAELGWVSPADGKVATIAAITGDRPGDRSILLVDGAGECQRWTLTEELARKIRRELNQRLD